jgi:hypothetical protein
MPLCFFFANGCLACVQRVTLQTAANPIVRRISIIVVAAPKAASPSVDDEAARLSIFRSHALAMIAATSRTAANANDRFVGHGSLRRVQRNRACEV